MKLTELVIAVATMMIFIAAARADASRLDRALDVGAIDASPIDQDQFRTRRPVLPACDRAELMVSTISEPTWDAKRRSSIIVVVVKNTGRVLAENFRVLLKDGGTIRTAFVRALGPSASHTIYFTLPYWVYNPDADFKVHVDSTNRVRECNESNNVKEFFGLG